MTHRSCVFSARFTLASFSRSSSSSASFFLRLPSPPAPPLVPIVPSFPPFFLHPVGIIRSFFFVVFVYRSPLRTPNARLLERWIGIHWKECEEKENGRTSRTKALEKALWTHESKGYGGASSSRRAVSSPRTKRTRRKCCFDVESRMVVKKRKDVVGRGLVRRNIDDSLSKKERRRLPFEPTTLTIRAPRTGKKWFVEEEKKPRKFCVIDDACALLVSFSFTDIFVR